MKCNQCGKEMLEGSNFCSFCGHQVTEEKEMNQQSNLATSNQGNEAEENLKTKPKKWLIGVGAGIGAILLAVAGIVYYFQVQAKSWDSWVTEYEKEIATYYLSEEQVGKLAGFTTQADSIERGKQQESLKQEMIDFKEQIITENEKYIKDIEAGLNQIKNDYDLTFAYADELEKLTKIQEEIQKLKESKQYPSAMEQIEVGKALGEKIQTLQSGWSVSIVQRDISQYPKVKLYLDIRDEMGNPLDQLNQKIFFLSQKDATNGAYVKREIISAMQLNENESLNINLVADVSGSMYSNISSVQGIMNNFVNTVQFGVGDQIALTQFSDTSFVTQNFTSDRNSIVSQINRMSAGGGTKLYDTLIESVSRVYGQSGAKCVIAFTDGLDNRSASTPEEVIRVAQNFGIPIFIIGIGYDVDHSILEYIASSTGGYYTNAININTMQEIYNSIYRAQKQVYCLEYQADDDMMALQDISIYLRGENGGGTIQYAYTPSDDFFDMLLNNYLNSYIEALTVGDPAVMSRAGYASTDGGVFKETSQYIQKHKSKLAEQLLQAEVTHVKYIDENTYEITSEEVYDIQWTRDYNKEVANDTSEESKEAREILDRYYYPEYLNGQMIKIYKTKTLKGHYKVKKSAEGRWQIADFTGSYENLGSDVYNAHIKGEE